MSPVPCYMLARFGIEDFGCGLGLCSTQHLSLGPCSLRIKYAPGKNSSLTNKWFISIGGNRLQEVVVGLWGNNL